jgi:hypothetical protein
MAVQYNPGGELQGESPRLISSGGNIYSTATLPVKRGVHTTGRGYWAGAVREDEDNPDVDNPSEVGAQTYIPASEEIDAAFDDDTSPEESMARTGFGTNLVRQENKKLKQMLDAAAGTCSKAVLTTRSVKVDMLLQNPEQLSEDDLLKSAASLAFLMEVTTVKAEREVLQSYAARLTEALRGVIQARHTVAKAIMTKPSEDREKKPDKLKHRKAQEKKVNDKGKVAYKYPKKGDGKGPNSDRGKGEPGGEGEEPAPAPEDVAEAQNSAPAPTVTPPPPVDPAPFAEALGLTPEQLKKLADKKDRKSFVDFFMSRSKLVEKHKYTPAYLARLFDALTMPPTPPAPQQPGSPLMPQPQPPQQQPGPAPTAPGSAPGSAGPNQATPLVPAAAKSLVVFTGATLNPQTLAMIDMLKSYKAETVEDIQKCVQAHYACTEREAGQKTISLLNRWERKGLVSIYPAKR